MALDDLTFEAMLLFSFILVLVLSCLCNNVIALATDCTSQLCGCGDIMIVRSVCADSVCLYDRDKACY
jgi:hypothetical protein